MRRINVIGIGAGDPEHLTLQAIRAMNQVDVFVHMGKGTEKDQLAQLRRDLLTEHVTRTYRWVEVQDPERDRTGPAYTSAVEDWHEARAALYERVLLEDVAESGVLGILVWGDPALYDSTLRVLDRITARGSVAFETWVVPGITSPQVLAAQHRITWNRIGGAVAVTTGRRLQDGMPADDVIVMLDAHCSFGVVPPDTEIYWGAYLGTPDELLLSGTVGSTGPEIERVRAEARADKGWIMDTYLLRRP